MFSSSIRVELHIAKLSAEGLHIATLPTGGTGCCQALYTGRTRCNIKEQHADIFKVN
jgi:hypothetical protein